MDSSLSPFAGSELSRNEKVPHLVTLINQGAFTTAVKQWPYNGSGTEEDPYVVTWIDNDPRDPQRWHVIYKWAVTLIMSLAVLAISFGSSVYTGGVKSLESEFHQGSEVVILGISLYVIGFALAPSIFAPLSEIYGRQLVFVATWSLYMVFNSATIASENMATVLSLRLLAGIFGSSPISNSGGVIADIFNPRERGLALSVFAASAFMGPVFGPIAGGFLGEAAGWRWVLALSAILNGVIFALCLSVPETYAPVLLRKRAQVLSLDTGDVYKSKSDCQETGQPWEVLKVALVRPWALLIREPIALLFSLYMAIIYGVLYMLFAAYPIVYQQQRAWSAGIGGLPFIGIAVGFLGAILYNIFIENKLYEQRIERDCGISNPEMRLPPAFVGAIILPIGLFWFAWTNSPDIPWLASVFSGVPFGFGMVIVFLSIINYLVDAYTIYAASALAANSVIRSLFAAVFPLFTNKMYGNLGSNWAATIPACLALVCVPLPFLFYRYGGVIRLRCKYAAQADAFMKQIRSQAA